MQIKLIISLLLTALAVVFIVQNVTVVEVRFLLWSLSMSRALWMLFLLAIGVIVGWLLHSYAQHRTQR